MKLLESLRADRSSKPRNKAEAFAGILMAAIDADAHISESEAEAFRVILERRKVFCEMSTAQYHALLEHLAGLLAKQPHEALRHCAEMLTAAERETAFANACDLLLFEGEMGEKEQGFYKRLVETLELDPAKAERIREVLELKNRE